MTHIRTVLSRPLPVVDPASIEYVIGILNAETGKYVKHETTFPLDCYTVAMWAKKLREDGHTVNIEKALPPVQTVRMGKLLWSSRSKNA